MNNSPSQASILQVVKSQLVEIKIQTVNSTAANYPFPTQNFLRQKYIVGIEAYTVTDMPVSPLSGYGLITAANMLASFLTLYEQQPEQPADAQNIVSMGQGQWNELFPLVDLHCVDNGTDPYVRERVYFTPRVVQWEKSFVQLANGVTLGNGAPIAYIFNVFYIGNAGDNVQG